MAHDLPQDVLNLDKERQFYLQQWQAALLGRATQVVARAIDLQQELDPLLFEELGIKIETGPGFVFNPLWFQQYLAGNVPTPLQPTRNKIKGVSKIPDAGQQKSKELEELLLDNAIALARGEAPPNSAVMNELKKSEQELNEALFQQLGPDYRATTAGATALQDFEKTKADVISQSARQDLATATQLSLQLNQEQRQTINDLFRNATALTTDVPIAQSNALLNISRGIGDPLINQIETKRQQLIQATQGQQKDSGFSAKDIASIAAIALQTAASV